MQTKRSFFSRFSLYLKRQKKWEIWLHGFSFLSGFYFGDIWAPGFIGWAFNVPESALTKGKEWAVNLIFGLIFVIFESRIKRIWIEGSGEYEAIVSAVHDFLRLMYNSVSSFKDIDVAPIEQRFREFVKWFRPKDEVLQSFAQTAISESGRHFDILEAALVGDGRASYADQIHIASILCSRGRNRFWATSTDPTMIFHRENALYYHALEKAADNYRDTAHHNETTSGPPALCRIFLCPKENFDYSLALYEMDFLEMYRRHVLWAEEIDKEPILFVPLDGGPDALQKVMLDADGTKNMLEDFMVVDDLFVYGRKGAYQKHIAPIRLIKGKREIERYAELFERLYARAKSIFDILDTKISTANGDEQLKLRYLKSLCAYIKNKAGNRQLYEQRFKDAQHGHSFFRKVCQLIENSQGGVIAVDMADTKVSRFYEAWRRHTAYMEFRAAGKKAVDARRHVIRLFILKNVPEANQEADIKEFLETFLTDGVHIAFLLECEAKKVFPGEEERLRYELDFLLGGIPDEYLPDILEECSEAKKRQFKIDAMRNNAFGFELFGDEPFVEEMLEWERNLIDFEGMWRKVECLAKMWHAPECLKSNDVDKNNRTAVETEVNRIWGELTKLRPV